MGKDKVNKGKDEKKEQPQKAATFTPVITKNVYKPLPRFGGCKNC